MQPDIKDMKKHPLIEKLEAQPATKLYSGGDFRITLQLNHDGEAHNDYVDFRGTKAAVLKVAKDCLKRALSGIANGEVRVVYMDVFRWEYDSVTRLGGLTIKAEF